MIDLFRMDPLDESRLQTVPIRVVPVDGRLTVNLLPDQAWVVVDV